MKSPPASEFHPKIGTVSRDNSNESSACPPIPCDLSIFPCRISDPFPQIPLILTMFPRFSRAGLDKTFRQFALRTGHRHDAPGMFGSHAPPDRNAFQVDSQRLDGLLQPRETSVCARAGGSRAAKRESSTLTTSSTSNCGQLKRYIRAGPERPPPRLQLGAAGGMTGDRISSGDNPDFS